MLIWERFLMQHISSGYPLKMRQENHDEHLAEINTMAVDLMLISYYYKRAVRNHRTLTDTQQSKSH